MEQENRIQRQWLLTARGIAYILIGGLMFFFANTYSAESGYLIGLMAAAAGICQLLFSSANRHTDRNYMLVAGGLAFNLLLRPEGCNTSLGLSGLFPIVLGALILILTQRLKEQAIISSISDRNRVNQ